MESTGACGAQQIAFGEEPEADVFQERGIEVQVDDEKAGRKVRGRQEHGEEHRKAVGGEVADRKAVGREVIKLQAHGIEAGRVEDDDQKGQLNDRRAALAARLAGTLARR